MKYLPLLFSIFFTVYHLQAQQVVYLGNNYAKGKIEIRYNLIETSSYGFNDYFDIQVSYVPEGGGNSIVLQELEGNKSVTYGSNKIITWDFSKELTGYGVDAKEFILKAVPAQSRKTSVINNRDFKIRGQIGLTQSKLLFPSLKTSTPFNRSNLNFGLIIKPGSYNTVSTQVGVLYEEKGYVFEEEDFTLRYLSVPFYLNIEAVPRFNFQIGIQPSYLLESTFGGLPYTQQFTQFDLGAVAGVAVDFEVVAIGAQVDYGLFDVLDTEFPTVQSILDDVDEVNNLSIRFYLQVDLFFWTDFL